MSYGAPWEQGVGAANLMPQHDIEVPGLVPDVGGVRPNMKEAQQHHSQHSQWQWCQEEKVSCREQPLVDHDHCLDVITEAVDGHHQGLDVIS